MCTEGEFVMAIKNLVKRRFPKVKLSAVLAEHGDVDIPAEMRDVMQSTIRRIPRSARWEMARAWRAAGLDKLLCVLGCPNAGQDPHP